VIDIVFLSLKGFFLRIDKGIFVAILTVMQLNVQQDNFNYLLEADGEIVSKILKRYPHAVTIAVAMQNYDETTKNIVKVLRYSLDNNQPQIVLSLIKILCVMNLELCEKLCNDSPEIVAYCNTNSYDIVADCVKRRTEIEKLEAVVPDLEELLAGIDSDQNRSSIDSSRKMLGLLE